MNRRALSLAVMVSVALHAPLPAYQVWVNINAQPQLLADKSTWAYVAENADGVFGGGNHMVGKTSPDVLRQVYGHLAGRPLLIEGEFGGFIRREIRLPKVKAAGGHITHLMPYREHVHAGPSPWGGGAMITPEDADLVHQYLGDGYELLPLIRQFETTQAMPPAARAYAREVGRLAYEFGIPSLRARYDDVIAATRWAIANEVDIFLLTPPIRRNLRNDEFIQEFVALLVEMRRQGVDLQSDHLVLVPSGYRLDLKGLPWIPEGSGDNYPNTLMGLTRWLLEHRDVADFVAAASELVGTAVSLDPASPTEGGITIERFPASTVSPGTALQATVGWADSQPHHRADILINGRVVVTTAELPATVNLPHLRPGRHSLLARVTDHSLRFHEARTTITVTPPTHTGETPNIVLVFTDDQGWADLGIHGVKDDVLTPHLDQLARDGALLTNAYITAPQCTPSRAGLVTGRYQQRFGLVDNLKRPLTLAEQTFGDLLRTAGYVTFMAGKWHLEELPSESIDAPYLPAGRGFDEYYQMFSPARDGFRHYLVSHDLAGQPMLEDNRIRQLRGYRTDAQTDATIKFIRRHHDKPFLAYVAYFAPHVPLEAPDHYLERFSESLPEKRRLALAMIAAMDDGVGRIRAELDRYGITDNTLIFFMSDNGAPLGGPWNGSLNDPFSGRKGTLLEGGIRVPFIAAWPGRIPAGQRIDDPVISLDIAATMAGIIGTHPNRPLDGINLLPRLENPEASLPERDLYFRWRQFKAIRHGDWKLHQDGRLFNLDSDPTEKIDLAADYPEIVRDLSTRLAAWETEVDAERESADL